MRPFSIIVGLILLAVHITARPIDGDHSSLVQDKMLASMTAAKIVKRGQPIVKPRQDPTTTSPELAPFPTLPPELPPPQPATQSCHAKDHYYWVSYSVLIGVPYIGPNDCDKTYHALESATISLSNWQCVEKDGNIQLWFNAFPNYGSTISSTLESRYPTVNSFNCPDN